MIPSPTLSISPRVVAGAVDFIGLPDSALLRERQLMRVLPFSSATLWRKVKDGQFPRPIRFEESNITAWRWGDVREWLDAQHQRKGGAA